MWLWDKTFSSVGTSLSVKCVIRLHDLRLLSALMDSILLFSFFFNHTKCIAFKPCSVPWEKSSALSRDVSQAAVTSYTELQRALVIAPSKHGCLAAKVQNWVIRANCLAFLPWTGRQRTLFDQTKLSPALPPGTPSVFNQSLTFSLQFPHTPEANWSQRVWVLCACGSLRCLAIPSRPATVHLQQ